MHSPPPTDTAASAPPPTLTYSPLLATPIKGSRHQGVGTASSLSLAPALATPAACHRRKQVRKLTAILYANPGWSAEVGGELRLHLLRPDGHSPFTTDVAPLDNRSCPFLVA